VLGSSCVTLRASLATCPWLGFVTQLLHSRNGLNQKALDLVRKELEAAESLAPRQTA